MIDPSVLGIIDQDSVWMVLKIGYLIAFLLYVLFAFVVLAQVKQMTKTIDGGINKQITLGSRIHLFVSVILFVLAIIVL